MASVFAVSILPSNSVLAAATFSSAFVPASVMASVFAVSILPSSSVLAAATFSSAFVPASATASSLAFLVSSSIFLSKSPIASVVAFNPSPAA